MSIVVITKNTPDTAATVTVTDGRLSWSDKLVVNPWDEYAITEAVLLKGEHGVSVTVMAIGGEEHRDALKHGLAIGCDQAVRVWDNALEGHDSLAFAKAAAAAIAKIGEADLVIFGREFVDSAADQHIFQVARKLGWNALGFVSRIESVDFGAKTIRVKRQTERGTETVSARLPAVISVVKDINEPKYPTLIGIRKAGKASVPVWDAAALGLDGDALTPRSRRITYRALPARDAQVEIIDGASAQEQAETLIQKLVEDNAL